VLVGEMASWALKRGKGLQGGGGTIIRRKRVKKTGKTQVKRGGEEVEICMS